VSLQEVLGLAFRVEAGELEEVLCQSGIAEVGGAGFCEA
jgi:hypothetical protein